MEENNLLGDDFDFDAFDAWAALANSDPDEFERQRQVCLRKAIDEHNGDKARLQVVQWRIDTKIKKVKALLNRMAPSPVQHIRNDIEEKN